jgi:hypothetical protein
LHKGGVILGRAAVSYFDIPKPGVGRKSKKDAARAILLILIMIAFGLTWTHRQKGPHILDKKTGAFIKTQQRTVWIIRELILLEDIFHMPQIVPGNLSYAPLRREPGLEVVFFSIWRTLSCEMEFVTPSLTTLSAIKCSVHRARPAGGAEQANIVTFAST